MMIDAYSISMMISPTVTSSLTATYYNYFLVPYVCIFKK